MNKETAQWNNFIKTGLKIGAVFLWIASTVFSLFGLIGVLRQTQTITGWLWWFFFFISLGLSALVNLLELVLNREDLNSLFRDWKVSDLVLWIFGIFSYMYDIYTNVAGLALFTLGTAEIFKVPFTELLIPLFFGLAIAIGPEPMYTKSMVMEYMPTYKDKHQDVTRSQNRPHFEPREKQRDFVRSVPDEIRKQNPISTFRR